MADNQVKKNRTNSRGNTENNKCYGNRIFYVFLLFGTLFLAWGVPYFWGKHTIKFKTEDIETINKTEAYYGDPIVFTIKGDYSSCIVGDEEYVCGDSTNTIRAQMPRKNIEITVVRMSKKEKLPKEETIDVVSQIQAILDSAVIYHKMSYNNLIHSDCKVGITIEGKVIEKMSYSDFIDYITTIPSISMVEVVYGEKIIAKDDKVMMFYVKEIRR